MSHDETIGEIFISPNNTMKAAYTLYAVDNDDIYAEIFVKQVKDSDINSEIYVKVDEDNDLDAIIDIKYRGYSDVFATIQPMGNNNVLAEIEVPPQNRMWILYEVQEPPKLTEIMNPIQDSFTREQFEYQTVNYGKNNSLVVGRDNGDYFRTYIQFNLENWNPSYVILDAKIRLHYSGVIPNGMELELFNLNKEWYELGITHLNRPSPTSLIVDEYENNTQERYVEFAATQTVLDWIANQDLNKGFLVRPKNELLSQLITFKSRESSTPPQLRIIYYDNRIYSTGRSQVFAEIFVWNARDSDVNSEITVDSVVGTSDIFSQIYVHRYEVPVDNDIYAEIIVNKPKIESEITVYRSDESGVDAILYVRSEAMSSRLDSEITISKPKVEGEIFVKYQDSIDAEITVVQDEDSVILSEISVSRPSIDSEIYIKYRNDILSEITVERSRDEDVDSEITISRETVKSEIYVKYRNSIDSEIIIRTLKDNSIDSEISVSKPIVWAEIKVVISDESDIDTELYVKYRHDIDSEISIRVEDENDIDSEIYVKHQNDTDSEITVRAIGEEDLDSEIYVKHVQDVLSEIAVSRPFILCEIEVKESNDIDSEIYIKHRDDIESEITIHIHDNILAEIDIVAIDVIESEISVSKPDIWAEIMIPYWDDSDVDSEITARVLRVSNINSEITVNKRARGYVFII